MLLFFQFISHRGYCYLSKYLRSLALPPTESACLPNCASMAAAAISTEAIALAVKSDQAVIPYFVPRMLYFRASADCSCSSYEDCLSWQSSSAMSSLVAMSLHFVYSNF